VPVKKNNYEKSPGVMGDVMKLPVWLSLLALCVVSCSSNPVNASHTPIPEQSPLAVSSDQTAAPESEATPQAPAGPDAAEILMKAMSKMGSVRTFHFAMDRKIFSENGESGTDELVAHIPITGKYNDPDQLQGTIILSANEKKAALDFIIISDQLYLREQSSDAWQMLDWQSQAAQTVRENAYLPLEQFSMDNLSEPELVGEMRLGGLSVYHVRGELGKLAGGQTDANENRVEFWIGKDNYLIYRVISEMIAGGSEELAVNSRSLVQVDYARFGEPVLIVAPRVDDSGGFRPTDTYSKTEQLNETLGESIPAAPAMQTSVLSLKLATLLNTAAGAPIAENSVN
jgi:hypothetical protein